MRKSILGIQGLMMLLVAASHAIAEEPAGERRLVTVVGELKPELSFQVSREEMQRIAQELAQLGNLPPVAINVNDLFEPGDEKSIRQAANDVASRFLEASKILIDLRIMVYRLSALSQVIRRKKDFEMIQKEYGRRFEARYAELVSLFALARDGLVNALWACRSEICVTTIAGAQQDLFSFARAINRGAEFKDKIESPLLRAALEDAYRQVAEATGKANGPYPGLVGKAMAGLVAASRQQEPLPKALSGIVGDGKTLRRLKLEAKGLPGRVFKTESVWLDELVTAKLKSIVLGEEPNVGPKMDLYRTYVLKCDGDRNAFHLIAYGRDRLYCSSERDGRDYEIRMRRFGPGLRGSDMKFLVVITSAVPITATGTWVGVGAGAGIFIGAEAGVFFGKNGSVATVIGGVTSLGAFAGVETMKVKLSR